MYRSVLVLFVCLGCGSSHSDAESPTDHPQSAVRIGGGNGARCEIAIEISAPTERLAAQAQYDWLRDHRAGYQVVRRTRAQCGDHTVEQITIVMPDGRQQDVFFDIRETLGKM